MFILRNYNMSVLEFVNDFRRAEEYQSLMKAGQTERILTRKTNLDAEIAPLSIAPPGANLYYEIFIVGFSE